MWFWLVCKHLASDWPLSPSGASSKELRVLHISYIVHYIIHTTNDITPYMVYCVVHSISFGSKPWFDFLYRCIFVLKNVYIFITKKYNLIASRLESPAVHP